MGQALKTDQFSRSLVNQNKIGGRLPCRLGTLPGLLQEGRPPQSHRLFLLFGPFPSFAPPFPPFVPSLRPWGRRLLSDGRGWYRGFCPLPLWECPRLLPSGAEVVDCPPWLCRSASFLPLRSSLLQRGEELPPPCEERPGIGLPRPGWFI